MRNGTKDAEFQGKGFVNSWEILVIFDLWDRPV
jgi:hypothetical protein